MRLLVVMALIGACLAPGSVAQGREWFATFPSGAEFKLEIAVTPSQRQRGYMYREKIPPTEGMLFVFGATERHGIWMKNCKVALDIIWLDDKYRVVEIFPEAQPCPADGPCPSMQPMQVADYVLEVAAGRAAEEGLELGDIIRVGAGSSLP